MGRRAQRAEWCYQSIYFSLEMLAEIVAEADRLDRTVSWLIRRAWRISRAQLGEGPTVPSVDAGAAS